MPIRISLLAICMLVLTCCTSPGHQPAAGTPPSGNNPIDSFLAGYKELRLPVTIGLCPEPNVISNSPPADSIAKKLGVIDQAHYGRIATNGNYTAIITLMAAECYWPCLTTIDEKGRLIDQKSMYLDNGGGADAGYRYYCQVKINSDLSLSSVDTLVFFDFDSLSGNPLNGGKSLQIVRSKTGKLCADGKIQLSEIKLDSTISIIDTANYSYR